MSKIAIFYHVGQLGDWKRIYQEQIQSLISSGLYDACDHIHVGVNGEEELPIILDKFNIRYNNNKILEAETLEELWRFCQKHDDYKVLYFHTKGANNTAFNTNNWRLYLEYYNLHNWKQSISKLETHDCVGTEYREYAVLLYRCFLVNFFAGNFWWANSDYIKKLNFIDLYRRDYDNGELILNDEGGARWNSEFWLFRGNPKYYNWFSFNENDMYNCGYEKEKYMINETKTNNIAIFYHVGQFGDWKRIYQEQIQSLISSGLYDATDYIHIGVNGEESLPVILDKFNIRYNNNKILEAETLEELWKFCQEHGNYRVLYMHTKGVTNLNEITNNWRLYLEYFNIHKWTDSIEKLNLFDCVGTEYTEQGRINSKYFNAPHFSGNFWWANSDYIKKLNYSDLYRNDYADATIIRDDEEGPRWNSEFWLFRANPSYFEWYNHNTENPYYCDFSPEKYMIQDNNMNQKKCKIVMITMFKNESSVIKRMLDSCLPYVDYYVIQNNGSTDGTDEIVKNFLIDNKLSGTLYDVEEGWVGFGWNRDHLLQTCQKTDHGCDWILKMDCDEVLEIDEDFNWSLLDDTTIQSFHIAAVNGTCIYHRAWMWNAKLPWSFNHDTCHETIKCDLEGVGEDFIRVDLPKSFRQVGYNQGQSWTVPTKFISDALILEEKMIKENTMLSDLYHFWYIGKSYMDAYPSDALCLGESHKREYARRCLYYFGEYLNHRDNYHNPTHIDEMIYITLIFMAEVNTYLGEYEKAIDEYKQSEKFAPGRNDHLFGLAYAYERKGDYEQMLNCTTIMMQPERVNPFPNYISFINTSMYHDEGDRVQNIHEFAKSKYEEQTKMKQPLPFYINTGQSKKLFVVDNFYSNPDEVREFALNVEYSEDLRWYKGLRSTIAYRPDGIKEAFESIMGEKIIAFDEHCYNGCFQICKAEDKQVYHYDLQKWAAMIYLTPDAPLVSGTRLHRSKINGARHVLDANVDQAFNGNFYDSTKFDMVDSVGNIYNRLVIMDAQSIHSAGPYFGSNKSDSRLTHLFFFD